MSGHHHHHSHSNELSGKKLGFTIFLNMLITIAQIIGGLMSGSMALLTDALHNFSDVISLIISWFANKISKRESSLQQTYGYKRAEILSAFINALSLIAIAIFLIVEAVERFSNPQPILGDLVIYFALGSIVVNFLSVLLLQNDAKDNMNMKSAYLHLLTDVMTSIAVMIGGILMKYFAIYWIDSVLTILIALYLIYASYALLIDSVKILMQFTPKNLDISLISGQIASLKEVENVHHVHFWQLNDKDIHFEAHIDLKEDVHISQFQKVLILIEEILHTHNIHHFNIQPEYSVDDKKDLICQH